MPFHPQILDDLAATGAHIAIDTETASLAEIRAVVNLWAHGIGNVTVRNAARLAPSDVVGIARALKNRVTFEE